MADHEIREFDFDERLVRIESNASHFLKSDQAWNFRKKKIIIDFAKIHSLGNGCYKREQFQGLEYVLPVLWKISIRIPGTSSLW